MRWLTWPIRFLRSLRFALQLQKARELVANGEPEHAIAVIHKMNETGRAQITARLYEAICHYKLRNYIISESIFTKILLGIDKDFELTPSNRDYFRAYCQMYIEKIAVDSGGNPDPGKRPDWTKVDFQGVSRDVLEDFPVKAGLPVWPRSLLARLVQ